MVEGAIAYLWRYMMRRMNPRNIVASAMAYAVLIGITACGGGGADDTAIAGSSAIGSQDAISDTATAQSKARPSPRPNPPPVVPNPVIVPADNTLALASTNGTGQDSIGLIQTCGISADGSQVIMTSDASNLVEGVAPFNSLKNVFLKNLRTGTVTRINTNSTGGLLSDATCVGMTPDAGVVVFTTPRIFPSLYTNSPGTEPAVYVKNLRTGAVTNVAPPLNTFENISRFRFQSISDDGNRVALTAEPTAQYIPYFFTPLGPAIPLLRDIPSGALINLAQTVSLDLNGNAEANTQLLLSPDGTKLAFNSRTNYPALGDTNGSTDAFVVDIASRSVRLVSPAGASGFTVLSFLSSGNRLALQNGAGVHIKDLGANTSRLVFAATFGIAQPVPSSFSGDGSLFTYTRPYYATASGRDEAVVRNTTTGQEQLVSITASGVAGNGESRFPLISRDGSRAVFESNASNLVQPTLLPTYRTYVKTLSTPAAIVGG
jgi:Tol biopolymer transport system component